MDIALRLSWLALAAIHLLPAFVLFRPAMTEQLYQIAPNGDAGVLIVHRGALFFAVVAVSLLALVDSESRRAASLLVAISMAGFLFVFVRAGMPMGALRTIALVDIVGLIPLALVTFHAWLRPGSSAA